jgi:hypothetical protein
MACVINKSSAPTAHPMAAVVPSSSEEVNHSSRLMCSPIALDIPGGDSTQDSGCCADRPQTAQPVTPSTHESQVMLKRPSTCNDSRGGGRALMQCTTGTCEPQLTDRSGGASRSTQSMIIQAPGSVAGSTAAASYSPLALRSPSYNPEHLSALAGSLRCPVGARLTALGGGFRSFASRTGLGSASSKQGP